MQKVYYIGHYADDSNINHYKFAVPAKAKMDYIIRAINEAGRSVEVWSLSDSKDKYIRMPHKVNVSENLSVSYILAVKTGNKFLNVISRVLKNVQLVWRILTCVEPGDAVLVYHSLAFVNGIKVARFIKKFRLIMDIEELYAHSWGWGEAARKKEEKFLEQADAFFLVNDTISNTVSIDGKPSIVVYGAYNVPNIKHEKFDDALIHVVYAGTIEEVKRGAFTAMESARHLTDKYKVHILGFGKEQTIQKLKKGIDEINAEKGYCAVTYDGFLSGQEFSDFLSKCSIGISSYIMEDNFTSNVFPSKLTTYVAHNLVVVTGYSETFVKAEISKNWVYYYDYNPKSVAQAVLEVDVDTKYINRELVERLHREFVEKLEVIL